MPLFSVLIDGVLLYLEAVDTPNFFTQRASSVAYVGEKSDSNVCALWVMYLQLHAVPDVSTRGGGNTWDINNIERFHEGFIKRFLPAILSCVEGSHGIHTTALLIAYVSYFVIEILE